MRRKPINLAIINCSPEAIGYSYSLEFKFDSLMSSELLNKYKTFDSVIYDFLWSKKYTFRE